MQEIIQSFFKERSLVNHQIASYDDCIPAGDNMISRMEKIIRNIRVGIDGEVDDDDGGFIKLDVVDQDIVIRMKNIQLGEPTIREANGSEHPSTPMECRLRKLTYMSPVTIDFQIVRNGIPSPKEEGVQVGSMPIMVRSKRCNLHPAHIAGDRQLYPTTSAEDSDSWKEMLKKKGEDPLDPGGYFIINGTERVLISTEDLAPNRVTVEINKRYAKRTEVAKIFSQKDGMRKPLTVEKRRDGMLMVKISTAGTTPIPVVLLMRALGIDNDQEIFTAIAGPTETFKYIVANINEVNDNEEYAVQNMLEAHEWLQKKFAAGQQKDYREARVDQLLDRELLPHLGDQGTDRKKKAVFLGRIVRQVLEMAMHSKEPNDKDHYANKRVRLAGDLIEDLFRVSSNQLARDLKYQLERHHNRKRELRITSCLRPDVLTSKIMHALATGNWVGGRSGVSQLLDRTTYLAALSHMRRVTSPLVRSQPHFEARDLHPTHWGRLCPNETPEGQNCGLVKNAAQMIDVSEYISEQDVRNQLDELDVYQPDDWSDGDRVHVNGDIYGIHKRGTNLVRHFKSARRRGTIPAEVSIRYDSENRDIFINTDKGRILRPLLILYDGAPRLTSQHLEALTNGEMTFKNLVNEGIVEWVDAEEEEDLYIAPKPFVLPATVPGGKFAGRPLTNENVEWTNLGEPGATSAKLKAKIRMPNNDWQIASFSVDLDYSTEHTHCEIDPQLVLGVCASLIPYPEHNSTPRVTGGTAMVKQSLGLPSSNYRLRPDTRAHILHYPQRSITKTRAMETTNFDSRPGGQNFIVAIMSLHGYNMQDAVIMNRGSIDLGLARSTFMRTYNAERRRFPGGQVEEIEKPGSSLQEVKGLKPDEAYIHLEADGLPLPEKYLEGGDVLVGKTSPPRFLEESSGGAFLMAQERRESSMLIRHGEKGWIDNVYVTESLDSGRLVRVMVRSHKVPEVG
ncbi:MAG: DNA-directed RNA polymerase subunit B'', partial [Candidatus Poseidoniaceae archaeon]|nr:DNA-directed RNA polymerase subunit B'' [Candidatus Poseidoniaceae archaeon]